MKNYLKNYDLSQNDLVSQSYDKSKNYDFIFIYLFMTVSHNEETQTFDLVSHNYDWIYLINY